MAMPTRKVQESRDRKSPLKVVVSKQERAEIETRAPAAGLSVSVYLRNLGLDFSRNRPWIMTDQGRLDGLFKLWLSASRDKSPMRAARFARSRAGVLSKCSAFVPSVLAEKTVGYKDGFSGLFAVRDPSNQR